jgi:hypothetical protein
MMRGTEIALLATSKTRKDKDENPLNPLSTRCPNPVYHDAIGRRRQQSEMHQMFLPSPNLSAPDSDCSSISSGCTYVIVRVPTAKELII